jgi:hypothetical protein
MSTPSPALAAPPRPLDPPTLERLTAYLQANWQSPEDYIVGLFETRDVVLLAEAHCLKHNLRLAHQLIPRLHAAGVYHFGMEFGAAEDQAQLDALVTAETYDADLARRLMFNYNVTWAFQEYLDVYRQAWALNQALPPEARKFRILNLSYRYDWSGAGPVRTPASAQRVFYKGGTEAHRAAVTWRAVMDRGEKMLALVGTPHAFTRYQQRVYDPHAEGFYRLDKHDFGNQLYAQAPHKVVTVMLHQPFDSRLSGAAELVYPARGALDQVLAQFADRRVGFDLLHSPLGDLPDTSYYATGADPFVLRQLADGYVYEQPFDQYEGCTVDEHFLAGRDWAEVQRQFPDPDWHPRPATLDEYWAHVRGIADPRHRFARLTAA